MNMPGLNGWHVDKTIPLALIFAIVMQGAIGVWWAGSLSSRLLNVEAAETSHSTQVEAMVRLQEQRYERIVRLEEKLAAQGTTLDRIEKKIDVLGPR
jgi:hypothetical protein